MKKPSTSAVSQEWQALNDALREADEDTCQRLLEKEKSEASRITFLKRIHSRLNKVRADRERKELEK